jgi:hypothetical protein
MIVLSQHPTAGSVSCRSAAGAGCWDTTCGPSGELCITLRFAGSASSMLRCPTGAAGGWCSSLRRLAGCCISRSRNLLQQHCLSSRAFPITHLGWASMPILLLVTWNSTCAWVHGAHTVPCLLCRQEPEPGSGFAEALHQWHAQVPRQHTRVWVSSRQLRQLCKRLLPGWALLLCAGLAGRRM